MFDPILAHLVEEAMVFAGVLIAIGTAASVAKNWNQTRAGGMQEAGVSRKLDELSAQLTELSTAVDAASIEIERISEGQRFTTRLLSERAVPEER